MTGLLTPADIKTAITEALNIDVNIPDGHRAALVTFINNDQAQIALASRVGNNWKVELIASHEWTGNNKFGIVATASW